MVRPIRSATREWKDAMVEIVDVTWFEQDRPALPGANIDAPVIGVRSSDRSHAEPQTLCQIHLGPILSEFVYSL
jgi:hypothetical protein